MWRRVKWWLIYMSPRHDVTVDTFNGLLTFENKQWLIGKYLYVMRSHEEHEIRAVADVLRKQGFLNAKADGAVLNIGANLGMTAIALVKGGYVKRAVAFEPAPGNYRLLVKNIEQNGLNEQIRAFPVALSSIDGELDMELSEDNSGDHRIRKTNSTGFYNEESRKTIQVPVATLDSLTRAGGSLNGEAITFIWVDVQGHEGHFFQGAREFLKTGVPVVSEFWPYGLSRSGISRTAFCDLVAEHFASFFVVTDKTSEQRPVEKLIGLFETFTSPRQFCTLVLMPR